MEKTNFEITEVKEFSNDTLFINRAKRKVSGSLNMFLINDGDYIVSYVPSLEISAYGSSIEEVHEMTVESISDYFRELSRLSSKELETELLKYNWTQNRMKSKNFLSNVHVDEKGVLKNFNLPEDTKITKELLVA